MDQFKDLQKCLKSSSLSYEEKLEALDSSLHTNDLMSIRTCHVPIYWLLEEYHSSTNDVQKLMLNKLSQLIIHENFNLISQNYGTTVAIVNFINKVDCSPDDQDLKKLISELLKIPTIITYLKQNTKNISDIFCKFLNLTGILSCNDFEIFSCLSNILQSATNREETANYFIKKCIFVLGNFYKVLLSSEIGTECKQKIIQFCQSMLFNRGGINKLAIFLSNIFEKKNEKCVKFTTLFTTLSSAQDKEISVDTEIATYQLIFEALLAMDKVDDLIIVRLSIFVAYILGIESTVSIVINNEKRQLLNEQHVSDVLNVHSSFIKSNMKIFKAVLDVISSRSITISENLPEITGLQWFQALVGRILSEQTISHSHIDVITSLFILDSTIIEPYLSKIFKVAFGKSSKLSQPVFLASFENFMETSLQIFSRLQRIHKFLAKFMDSLVAVEDFNAQSILSVSFIEKLNKVMIVLPSTHSLNLIKTILDHLEKLIDNFNDGNINTSLLHVISLLLCTTLSSCRLLCYTLPRAVIDSFINLINNLKDLLSRFGSLILLRPHNRQIMQPFLKMCLVWGEMQVLIYCYGSEDDLPDLKEDSSPADLSPLLSFISGEQWSVFAERITNFGDDQCNRCLLKLVLQKLKVAHLFGDKSQINAEQTAKYILMRLKAEIHGLTVINSIEPVEFDILSHYLNVEEASTLMEKTYSHLECSDIDTFKRWCEDSHLLENKKFVAATFENICRRITQVFSEKMIHSSKRSLIEIMSIVTSTHLSEKNELFYDILNQSFELTREETTIDIGNSLQHAFQCLKLLPLPFIASTFKGEPLARITALLLLVNSSEVLIAVFENLLQLTTEVSDCFDIGSCIKWVMCNISDRFTRANIVETLVIKSMQTEKGIVQFSALIKSLKHISFSSTELEMSVIIYNSIRKCWGLGKRSEEKNNKLGGLRKKLVKRLRKAFAELQENEHLEWPVLDAFAVLLLINERRGTMEKLNLTHTSKYVTKAIASIKEGVLIGNDIQVQSSLNFLIAILKCSKVLRASLEEGFVYNVWAQLQDFDFEKLWAHVYSASSDEEFQKIINDILNRIKSALVTPAYEDILWEDCPPLPKKLRPLFVKPKRIPNEWPKASLSALKIFASSLLGKKIAIWRKAMWSIFKETNYILPSCNDGGLNLLNWLEFLLFSATNPKITMTSKILDYLLDVLLAAPTEGVTFLEHFVVRINLLSVIIGPKSAFFKEKVHLVFQVFKQLLNWLIQESNISMNLSEKEETDRSLAAYHLEKWSSIFIQKEVGRELPLFIAEVLVALTSVGIRTAVKMHLQNTVFILLRNMDEHTNQFLLRVLPAGTQSVFANLDSQYRRFYKYKGKI